MKIFGICINHELTRGSKWTADLVLEREVGGPIQLDVTSAPQEYSGRDFFTFADVRDDFGWLDVYRNTAATKLNPAQYFQANGISCIAHKLCSLGKEPSVVLFGETPEAFADVVGVQVLSLDGFRVLLNTTFPAVKITKSGDTFTATTDSPADIYWEATGGVLSSTRSKSGEPIKLTGAATGTKVRAGWKYFSNAVEVAL